MVHQLRPPASKGKTRQQHIGTTVTPEAERRIAGPSRRTGIAERSGYHRDTALRQGIQKSEGTPFRSSCSPRTQAGLVGDLMPETLALDSKEIEKKFGYSHAVRNVNL